MVENLRENAIEETILDIIRNKYNKDSNPPEGIDMPNIVSQLAKQSLYIDEVSINLLIEKLINEGIIKRIGIRNDCYTLVQGSHL